MKKIRLVATLLVIVLASAVSSCDSEPVDLLLYETTDDTGTDDGSTDDGSTDDGTTDDVTDDGTDDTIGGDDTYWPMALNNEWTLMTDGVEDDPMKMTSSVQISGNTYYNMNYFFTNAGNGGFTGSALQQLRESDGVYSVRISTVIPSSAPGAPTITIAPYEIKFFRDDLAAGETWTQTVTQVTSYEPAIIPPLSSTIEVLGTVVQKGLTITVNGVTYNDVIYCTCKQTTMGTVTLSHYWFAKNVGPVKVRLTAEGMDITRTLVSYDLF